MKVILIVILIILCACLGCGISSSYKQKKKFFDTYYQFLLFIKLDIGFSASKLTEIISKFKSDVSNKDFIQLLDNYLNYLESNTILNKNSLFKNINILNGQEKEDVINFFNLLGKTDAISQVEVIKNKTEQVKMICEKLKSECEKYCPLFIKLGVLLGVFLALLII